MATPAVKFTPPKVAQIKPGKLLIDGKWVDARSGKRFDVLNPATGQVLTTVAEGDKADVDLAVAAARRAFEGAWAKLEPRDRQRLIWKVGDLILENADELAEIESLDNGKPIRESRNVDIPMAAEVFRYYAGWVTKIHGETIPVNGPFFNYTRREPLGVVGQIIPWNFPLLMAAWKLAPALACGNTSVLKPAEQTPLTALRLGELVLEAGIPEGVVNIITGFGPTSGAAITEHMDVDKVAFTGETTTGRIIMEACAKSNMKKLSLELGGKSPNIVFADADLDKAAEGVTTKSIFTANAGQACVGGSRILIQRPVLNEMLTRMEAIVKQHKIGDPFDAATTMGPVISKAQYDKIVGYIEMGKKETKLVFGGRYGAELVPSLPGGFWIEPTLFMTENNALRICQEEIFGPVATVIPFDTEEQAFAIANDSRFGLAAGVWTKDAARMNRCVRAINAGTVWVNTYLHIGYELPFMGVKDSGYGHDDVMEFTREKTAVIANG